MHDTRKRTSNGGEHGEKRPLLGDERQNSVVQPHTRPKKKKIFACSCILTAEMLERVAFYSITGNLVLFLNKDPFMWMSYNAQNALFIFMGLCFALCLFGAWISDAYLGKFRTIFIFFLIYIGGYIFLPTLSPLPPKETLPSICPVNLVNSTLTLAPRNNSDDKIILHDVPPSNWTDLEDAEMDKNPGAENCAAVVYVAIVVLAIGSSAVKTNIAPFGGDQVKFEGPGSSRIFFNWFYWSVNIGSFIALGPIAYLQQEQSFFLGYLIPNICLVLSFFIFLIGTKVYLCKPPSGSPLTTIFKVTREACVMKRKRSPAAKSKHAMRFVDAAGSSRDLAPLSFLDHAKSRYGGSFHDKDVEEVRGLGRMVLLFLTMIPYWIGYYQMETTFLTQGLHMLLGPSSTSHSSDASKGFQIPAAWLSLLDVVFIIILIPIMDRIVYPYLDRKGHPLRLKDRLAIGMGVALLAMVCAGVVENRRLAIYWENNTSHDIPQRIGNSTYYAANMSIAWQIPQYALIGVGEVFASIAGLELAYSLSPKGMQSIVMAIFYLVAGVGSFLGTATVFMFRGTWFLSSDMGDINSRAPCNWDKKKICAESHLDYYFFFLAGVQLVGLVIYIILARWLGIGEECAQKRNPLIKSINPTPADVSGVVSSVGDSAPEDTAAKEVST